jgi:hypothetical protein
LGSAASKDLRQQFFRDGGHKHAQNKLVLAKPSKSLWIVGDAERAISGSGGVWMGRLVGSIHKPIEIVTLKESLKLMVPNQVIVLGKFGNRLCKT